jgi:hypothetical protein
VLGVRLQRCNCSLLLAQLRTRVKGAGRTVFRGEQGLSWQAVRAETLHPAHLVS